MIITRGIQQEDINVKWMEHKENLSDHRLAEIELKIDKLSRDLGKEKKVKSKKHAEWASRTMLEMILNGEGL